MWRGCCRLNISVAASFVWRCLSSSTMTPFSHPAHRTGQADLLHPALGQDFTPLLSRATPSAVSEHSAEFIGCPISRSFTTYFVCLELRSLPSAGITRLSGTTNLSATPRRPACPSRASGWSSLTALWGFPCFVRFPCVHAAATTPAQRLDVSLRSFHPDVAAFPERVVGSACTLSFSRCYGADGGRDGTIVT